MKNINYIIMLAFFASCSHQRFYVKDSEELNAVTVKECITVTFKEVDSGDAVKKKACFDRKLSSVDKERYVKFFKKEKPELQSVVSKAKETKDESDDE